jgi:formylglycine-generating enzyme required for sulfatase activity
LDASGRASTAVPEREQRRAGFDPAESAGLFVGVSRFDDPLFAEVSFAVDDAVDLAHLFAFELRLVAGGKIVLGLAGDPRKPDSQARLQELLDAGAKSLPARQTDVYGQLDAQRKAAGSKGLFVAAFATHGFSDQGGDFLVAADSLRRRIVRTGVAIDEVFDDVARSLAPRRLVLLDACRERLSSSTRGGDPAAAMSAGFADAIGRASGQAVLAGATLGGYAYDDPARRNGVFTASILDGLRGAAPADERGYVTVGTLADYLQEQVAVWVGDHRPDHAGRSQGIARRLEGAVAQLPLAVDAVRRQAEEARRRRLDAARARLRENIGETISGTFFDEIAAVLAADPPAADLEALLEEIDALDGGLRSQRSLAYYWHLRQTPPVSTQEDRKAVTAARRVETGPSGDRAKRPLGRSLAALAGLVTALVVVGIWRWPPLDGGSQPPEASETAAEAQPPAPTRWLVAGDLWDGPLGMRFRYIPPGRFTMGSPKDEPGRHEGESQHEVRLTRGFWLAQSEVTQGQWQELMRNNPSRFQGCLDCPVEQVSWWDAVTFANRLSEKSELESCYALNGCAGKPGTEGYACESAELRQGSACAGFRLPTEAEWEYAARAETTEAAFSSELDAIAWYSENSDSRTHPVAGKEANAWGLHDMLGNVWEWTGDWYAAYPTEAVTDPTGPAKGSGRVIRGGAWYGLARGVRCASRIALDPGDRSVLLGFRLARGQAAPGAEPR